MKTSEVLNTAADLIEQDGWTTGSIGMAVGGPHCIQGAIQAVMGITRKHSNSYPYFTTHPCAAGDAVRDYLNGACYQQVWLYNDTHTAAEVIEVLRATALIEAAREHAHEEAAAPVGVTS